MWHPSPEELARLVDETPTPAEAQHVATCGECAAELHAMRAQHDALGALPRILPVPTSWEIMRHRMEREGLLRAAPGRLGWMPGVAAALALFVAGGATGIAFGGGLSDAPRPVAITSEPVSPATPAAPIAVSLDSALDSAPASEPVVAEKPAPDAPGLAARDEFDAHDTDDLTGLYGTPAPD